MPSYAVIDLGAVSNFGFPIVVGNNGWVLSLDGKRWEWDQTSSLQQAIGVWSMNNHGDVVGRTNGGDPALWSKDSDSPQTYTETGQIPGWNEFEEEFEIVDDYPVYTSLDAIDDNGVLAASKWVTFFQGQKNTDGFIDETQLGSIQYSIEQDGEDPPHFYPEVWGISRHAYDINSSGDGVGRYYDYGAKTKNTTICPTRRVMAFLLFATELLRICQTIQFGVMVYSLSMRMATQHSATTFITRILRSHFPMGFGA